MDLEGHLHKGLPPVETALRLEDAGGRGWNALGGDLPFPVLVLRDADLRHNQATMSAFCAGHGASLAPHGKTTMSRQLIRRQLDDGVWGMTAANPTQARAMRDFGATRLLIANQVIDPIGLRWMVREVAAGSGVWIACLVDSLRGVELMEEALADAPAGVRLPVLLEVGEVGQRSGCRTQEEGLDVAAAVGRATHLQLVGVEVFEGVIGHDAEPRTLAAVDAFLTRQRELALALARRGDFQGLDEILVTAGGSLYFDRVVAVLGGSRPLEQPVRLVLRGGCYLTIDHANYQHAGPLGHRSGGPELRPAFELWGLVHSQPEPGLALLGFGKRDVSYDQGLPIPLRVRTRDGAERDAKGFTVAKLNDQHAFLHFPAGDPLQVGDLVCCGIDHPCTAFDKWRVIPIVDENYRVIELAETSF
jgi:D-serine deaminase-like pyridoxal phosphate-dependent protein